VFVTGKRNMVVNQNRPVRVEVEVWTVWLSARAIRSGKIRGMVLL